MAYQVSVKLLVSLISLKAWQYFKHNFKLVEHDKFDRVLYIK